MPGILSVLTAAFVVVIAMGCGSTPTGSTLLVETPVPVSSPNPTATAIVPTETPVPPPPPPARPVPPTALPQPTPTPVEGPGYGGFYIDPDDDSIVYIYMVNPSQEGAEWLGRTRIGNVVYEGTKKVKEVRPIQGRYTYYQLYHWHTRRLSDSGVWSVPEVTMSGIDVATNSIVIGMECEHSRGRVERELREVLARTNVIPVDAVTFEVAGRPQLGGPPDFGCAPREMIDPATGVSSPGFGGLFWESSPGNYGTLNIYLLEPSRDEAEELAVDIIGREWAERATDLRVLSGQYTWEQLLKWYRSIKSVGLDVPGARLVPDFMETRNRLVVNISREHNPDAEADVEDVLVQLNVPLEAVVFEEK